jgi:GNAT superfamily N-acetyltransferase
MTKPPVSIRPATLADADPVISLVRLSMGDEVDWIFGQERSHPTETVMKALFQRKANRLSCEVCWVAELEGRIVGLLLAFPGRELRRLELRTGLHLVWIFGLGATWQLARRQPLYGTLVEALQDEFYISNLAVSPEEQGRGIGAALLSFADELSRAAGLWKTSLIVTFDNPARRLYDRCGYELIHSYKIDHPVLAHGSGGFHRMVKRLATAPSVETS